MFSPIASLDCLLFNFPKMSLTPLQDLQPCGLYLRGWYGDHADRGVGHGGQQQHRWNRWALDTCVFSLPFMVLELPYITACLHFASLLCDAPVQNTEGGLEVIIFLIYFFSLLKKRCNKLPLRWCFALVPIAPTEKPTRAGWKMPQKLLSNVCLRLGGAELDACVCHGHFIKHVLCDFVYVTLAYI